MIASYKALTEESLVDPAFDFIEELTFKLDLFREIMENHVSNQDLFIQRQALLTLYYCVSEKP